MENHLNPQPDSAFSSDDHHFRRENRVLRWQRIAAYVVAHPEDLSIALGNIDRWLARGRVQAAPLLEWRDLIHAAQGSPDAFRDLIDFLSSPNHDSERIKSCSPFAGLPCLTHPE